MSSKEAKLLIERVLRRKLSEKEVKEMLNYYSWVMDGLQSATQLNDNDTEFVTVYRPEE